jgi:hypothetical protein
MVVAADATGVGTCPFPGCIFPPTLLERCTAKGIDGEQCHQQMHHLCQTELENYV